jgi:hypothetical protein
VSFREHPLPATQGPGFPSRALLGISEVFILYVLLVKELKDYANKKKARAFRIRRLIPPLFETGEPHLSTPRSLIVRTGVEPNYLFYAKIVI